MRPVFLLAPLLLASCAAQPSSGGHVFSLVTTTEERDAGFALAEQILKEDGLYRPTSPATAYVNTLCEKIFSTTEAASTTPLKCNLIDDGDFNASATPGYLMVNRGLLPFLNSEDELAAVLGHESGHITARHATQAVTRDKLGWLSVAGLAVLTADANNPVATETVIDTGTEAFGLTHKAFSRSEESEADTLGRRYMKKAGYDPRSSVSVARAMLGYDAYTQKQITLFNNGEQKGQGIYDKLRSSHPGSQERVDAALKEAGEPGPDLNTPGRRRYMEAIEGLTFGPARRYGIARADQLVLTQQRTVIPLPEETTTAYVSSHQYRVLGTWLVGHVPTNTYLTITSLKVRTGHSPGWLVQTLLPTLHGPVERLKIGQKEKEVTGYTATYRYLLNDRRYRIVAVGAPFPLKEMLVVTIVYPNEETMRRHDATFLANLQKMRFLTEGEAAKFQQLTLHTFTASAGDTVARRAAQLPVGGLKEDLFRALNNLGRDEQLRPGTLYKTVVDSNP